MQGDLALTALCIQIHVVQSERRPQSSAFGSGRGTLAGAPCSRPPGPLTELPAPLQVRPCSRQPASEERHPQCDDAVAGVRPSSCWRPCVAGRQGWRAPRNQIAVPGPALALALAPRPDASERRRAVDCAKSGASGPSAARRSSTSRARSVGSGRSWPGPRSWHWGPPRCSRAAASRCSSCAMWEAAR